MQHFPPSSAACVELFARAAAQANLPVAWASQPGLHAILAHESQGYVGRPNYSYGERASLAAVDRWPEVWAELRAGRLTGAFVGDPAKRLRSSATGLGQLILPNVRRLYPGGVDGIGDALAEAVGMLRYIWGRYTNPAHAWAEYGRHAEGY